METREAVGEEAREARGDSEPDADLLGRDGALHGRHRALDVLDERQHALAQRRQREPFRSAKHERCAHQSFECREPPPDGRVLDRERTCRARQRPRPHRVEEVPQIVPVEVVGGRHRSLPVRVRTPLGVSGESTRSAGGAKTRR